MDLNFNELRVLVPVLCERFSKYALEILQSESDFENNESLKIDLDSEEIYDAMHVLVLALQELYGHRPLPF